MRRTYPFFLLAAALAMATARAWACDDAFITFRVVAQFLDGHGPVFNIGERVQVFTHPLWFMVLAVWAGLGLSLFPGVMWLSLALFAAGLVFLGLAWRDKPLALAAAFVTMTMSQSLMDFATGGLETPLTFALFAAALFALRGGRTLLALAALALLPLNRLDLLPWALPFAWIAARPGVRPRAAAFAILCAPAAAWMAFSTVYYGAPLPNTAVAKLGIEVWGRLDQGLAYVVGSFAHDPGAMALASMGLYYAARYWRRLPEGIDRRIAGAGLASAAVGLAYPVWSGGDFMLGRFVLPALWAFIAVILASFPESTRVNRKAAAVSFAVLAAFLVITGHSTTNLWIGMKNESLMRSVGYAGATDERRVYLPWFGAYAPERAVIRRETGPGTGKPEVVGMLGRTAYLGRGEQDMIDIWALSDPFLGRFAAIANGRPGHAYRPLPPEYPRWREPGHSFGDPAVDALARDLRLAHRSAALWGVERFAAIARLAVHPLFPQDALLTSDEGGAVRIAVKPARMFRPWPGAASFVVWMRLHDAGKLRYGIELPVGLDRNCAPVAVAKEASDLTGVDVAAGETLVLHCPKPMLGREAILLRVGVRQVIGGKPHVEYDEAIEAVRPAFWWISGLPAWLVQGWTEKPKPAVTVAFALLLAAGLLALRRA
jgi:arabinofuranosyltransferase